MPKSGNISDTAAAELHNWTRVVNKLTGTTNTQLNPVVLV
jgi:hypothetical protein